MRLLLAALFLSLLFFASACSDSTGSGRQPSPQPEPGSYRTEAAFPNLSFDRPLDLQHPGDGSNRLFVVEQAGVIKVFENRADVDQAAVFLDIRNLVERGGEKGLLGLAFHPEYESNGLFYVNYTAPNPLRTIISRFKVSADDPNQADKSSETEILTFSQPYGNHNGGQVRFGPDGYLYIAVGDGGSGGDPRDNGQNRKSLLGSILRIDVDRREDGRNYGIPSQNPFAENDEGFREEIYAYGLRNPWRFSFDTDSGQLWAGDVGQNSYEEIDIIEAGQNYGWNVMEGNHCFEPSSGCDRSGLVPPVWEYGRSEGQSVTGGFVYRGPSLTGLTGWYIYADFASGRIWALDHSDPANPKNIELTDTDVPVSSFGTDAENELYFCAFDGTVYTLSKTSQ